MGGDVVGGKVIGLGAVPVGGLAVHNGQAGGLKRFRGAVAAVVAVDGAGFAFHNGHFAFAANLLNEVFGAHLAHFHVVGGHIRIHGAAQLCQGFHVDGFVDVHNFDALLGGVGNGVVQVHVRDGRHANGLVALRDGVFQQGNLAFHVVLGVRGVDVHFDAQFFGFGLNAVAHGLPVLAGQHLQNDGVFGVALGRACAGRRSRRRARGGRAAGSGGAAAGNQGQGHGQRQHKCKCFFHVISSIFIISGRVGRLRFPRGGG